jgi:hypothetical protein
MHVMLYFLFLFFDMTPVFVMQYLYRPKGKKKTRVRSGI